MIRPRTSPPARPRVALSGRLVDLRALVACYGDIPLRVLARDMARDLTGPDAPDYPPAHMPAHS